MSFLQIHNEQSYCDALERASQFFDDPPQINSQEAEEFQALLSAIENCDLKHYRIETPLRESI